VYTSMEYHFKMAYFINIYLDIRRAKADTSLKAGVLYVLLSPPSQ